MDAHDIAFRFNTASKSYATTMLRQAVMRPVFGTLRTEKQRHAAFKKLLSLWREQLIKLHHAGFDISKAKVVSARNCPPPGSGGDLNLKPCKLRSCPFCYTRKLLVLRERIKTACCETLATVKQLRFVTYTLLVDDPDKHTEQLHLDNTFSSWRSIADIVATHDAVRRRIRERLFPKAYGTGGMINFIPRVYKEPVDSLIGYMATHHRYIGLLPASAVPDVPGKGKTYDRSVPTQRELMWILPSMFTYPAEWLRTDPKIMVELLSAARNRRLFTRTGVFKDTKT